MSGLDMLIKSALGVDPAVIKQQFEQGIAELAKTLKHFNDKLTLIEKQNEEILRLLSAEPDEEQVNGKNSSAAPDGADGTIAVVITGAEGVNDGKAAGSGGGVSSPQVPARVSRRVASPRKAQ